LASPRIDDPRDAVVAERIEDIPILVDSLLVRIGGELGRPGMRVSGAALDALVDYTWPGNLRELCNLLERAVLLCDGGTIGVRELRLHARSETISRSATGSSTDDLTLAERPAPGTRRRVAIYRSLAVQNPDVYQPYAARTLDNLGRLSHAQNRRAEARMYYEEALAIYRQSASLAPATYQPRVQEVERDLRLLGAVNP